MGLAAVTAASALPPLVHYDPYYLYLLGTGLLFAALASAWNLLASAGQISFGHAAFFGAGAYTSALLVQRAAWNPWLGVMAAAAAGALAAVPIGLVSHRLAGAALALATLAYAEAWRVVALNWTELTGGGAGLVGIPSLPPFPVPFAPAGADERGRSYYLALALVGTALVAFATLRRTRVGLAWAAIREREARARVLGIAPTRYKLLAFVCSGVLTAAGGALYAHAVRFVEPDLVFGRSISILPLVMATFGGVHTLWGPPVGALMLYLTSELLLQPWLPQLHQLPYALALLVVVLRLPRGLAGLSEGASIGRASPCGGRASPCGGRASPCGAPSEASPRRPLRAGHLEGRRPFHRAPGSPGRAPGAAAPTRPILELCGVSKRVGGAAILSGIDLEVPPASLVALVGPNGAGKTTLFEVVSGLTPPTAGTVRVDGIDITRWPPERITRLGVGRTFQSARLFRDLPALDNVLVGVAFGRGRGRGAGERRARAQRLLEIVGLAGKVTARARELSLGEQKRLELAVALASEPRLLLLDELASGLSPRGREEVIGFYERLRERGLAVVAIEHSLGVLGELADRIVVLDGGRVVAAGPPGEVLASRAVREAYWGEEEPV